MKIGPLDTKPPVPAASGDRKVHGGPLPRTTEASTQVDLSPAAKLLSGATAEHSFDAKKVERIAQAIRDGKFKINPEAIADKLITNATELLGRKTN